MNQLGNQTPSPAANKRCAKSRLGLLLFSSAVAFAVNSVSAAVQNFSYSGAPVLFTAPTTGIYDITAWGAMGGPSIGTIGGLGAEIGGTFNLTAGQV